MLMCMQTCEGVLLEAGDTLMESDTVRKIGFIGSTRVGKLLFAAATDTVKKVGEAPVLLAPIHVN